MVVSNGLASDSRPEMLKGSGSGGCSLGSSGLKSPFLTSGLIEPDFNIVLPMFSQMNSGNDVVMLDHPK